MTPASALLEDQPPAEPPAATDQNGSPSNLAGSAAPSCGDCAPIWHHIHCGCETCAPDVCRFDQYWANWPCCTTSEYCPNPCSNCYHGSCRKCADCDGWVCDSCYCDVYGQPDSVGRSAAQFGWWGVDSDGSRQKTGEYQDLSSSPFWDFDTLRSDGTRTFDITASGLDNEATNARVNIFGPRGSAKVNFQRLPAPGGP